MDENIIESLITEKTSAIIPVHYAGVACDLDEIMRIAEKHSLYVIKDAVLEFDRFYRTKSLCGIGHLGCLAFHQTKNLQCAEGGALVVNDNRFLNRVINILEKGQI
jgi:dTDP-4-amino-4,6-dideoxygalactose transaminase